MEVSLALAQVHAISSLARYRRHGGVGPLKRGRMQLCTTPALEGAPFMAVSFMLPPNPPHCLQLQWREREQLPTHSAKRVVVVIEDPLVTVFVTNVCQSSQFAAVHVSKDVLILAPLVTLVTGDLPFCVKNSGQENRIAGLSNHGLAKYLHCSAARNLFTDPLFLVCEIGVSVRLEGGGGDGVKTRRPSVSPSSTSLPRSLLLSPPANRNLSQIGRAHV